MGNYVQNFAIQFMNKRRISIEEHPVIYIFLTEVPLEVHL